MSVGISTSKIAWSRFVRLVPIALFLLAPIAASIGGERPVDGVAIAGATCPVDVGRGGDTASTPSDTRGGDGCVVFEHSGQFDTFVYTGANQTWTVPPGITSAIVHVVGAGGGGGRSGTAAFGGGGGYATGRLGVTPGQRFDVIVGGSGRRQCFADVPPLANLAQRHNFSFGGGGSGNGAAPYNCTFASGGGRSAVRIEGDSEDLVTAGGGGGGGYAGAGGGGGGLVGAAGGGVGGAGGTQSAGGGSSSPEIGVSGIKYAGGWAGFSETDDSVASEGGGGGGGYFGGGAGGNNGGGGGGSSFLGVLASASTTAANGRDAGIAAPTSSVSPTIPPQAAIGSSITATPATWTEMGESVFRWQHSANGTSFSDIDGATSPSFVPTTPGFLRVVETRSNFLGSASAVSLLATVPDTLLASLVATDGILTPAFDPMRLSYSIRVGYRTRTLRLSPVASQVGATVTVGGKALKSGGESDDIDLAVGDTAVIVRVEFAGAVTETTVVVTRAEATVPAAPVIKSVDPGDGSLTVVFDPPADDGGEPIDLYEYSVDGTTWKIAESSTNTFLISGLKNGVVYDVRMRAVNKIGSGGVSASVAGTPKSATTPANEVVTPVPSPSSVSIMPSTSVGSRPERQRQSRSSSTTVVETAGPPLATTTTSVNVTSSTDGPEPPLPSGASTTLPTSATTPVRPEVSPGLKFELVPEFGVGDLAPGARVRAMASGLRPSSPVRLEFHSEPLLLAEGMADGDGNATLTATLPEGLPSGNHLLSLTGVDPAGESLLSVVALQINERGVISQLTPSGSALSELPNAAHVSRMLATNSAPFDAKSDVSGAVALAGAAVVLMGLATGGSGGARSKEPSPGGDSSEDASESAESRRDEAAEGSLASTDAKVLYFTGEGDGAWGDRSRLWMMPGWVSLAGALRAAVRCVERWSTLAVRILQDGTWCRAVFGVGAMVPWVVGLVLGLLAGRSIEGVAVPPAFGFVAGIVVVSFLDSLAGAVAWATFTLYVALNGGIATWFDVRTILGLGVLFVALPLIAASFRPVVRERGDEAGRLVVRGFDYLVVSLFVSFAGSSAYQALNGLSGLAVVDAGHADALRWLCMVVVVVRMLAEDGTAAWFPQRRSEAALIVERGTFAAVPYVNLALLIAVYALTAGPYMGMGPRTWIVMGLMAVVPLVKIRRNRLPNVETLHRWFPRGILRSVVMLFVMAWYGRWLIDVTGADARAAVPLMLIPGIVIGLIDCLGRDGGTWPDSRAKNLAGIVLWAVSFSVVAGWVTP